MELWDDVRTVLRDGVDVAANMAVSEPDERFPWPH